MPTTPTGHFALWLTFDDRAQTPLADLIAKLADRHGGAVFRPHITLLAGLADKQAQQCASGVAKLAAPLAVQIAAIDTEPHYFRFLTLRVAGNSALTALRARACTMAGVADAPFAPHISLLYHTPDAALQARCQRELATDDDWLAVADSALTINSLTLMSVEATPERWRECRRVALAQ